MRRIILAAALLFVSVPVVASPTPSVGDTVCVHIRGDGHSGGVDGPGTVLAVNGTHIDVNVNGVTFYTVEDIDFVGDPDAAAGYWSPTCGGGLGDPVEIS